MLKVVPERLTYDHPDFTAYDISGEDYLRQWIIVNPDGDSLHLTSDARQITYTADLSDDSLQVVLVVSNGLCPDTAQATVTMLYTTLFAPNVFTPGLDINNRFAIVGHGLKQLELEIYNRNGECIFRTADAASGWDGTCGGRPCPQGAYVWRPSYIAAERPNTTRTAIGTVTLLR
jgi:gliding motility-associated-like protein